MIKRLNLLNSKIAEAVLNLQIPSYQVEAEILNYPELPPLKDSIQTLQNCGETFYGYFIEEDLVGAISFRIQENTTLDIHRMVVHPSHFRKGIAKALLNFIENIHSEVNTILVTTGTENSPAIKLYIQSGYTVTDTILLPDGLSLTSLMKRVS